MARTAGLGVVGVLGVVEAIDATDCPVCGCVASIVAPSCPEGCPDGHGDECPDRVCVDCGIALLVDPALSSGGAAYGGRVHRTA